MYFYNIILNILFILFSSILICMVVSVTHTDLIPSFLILYNSIECFFFFYKFIKYIYSMIYINKKC